MEYMSEKLYHRMPAAIQNFLLTRYGRKIKSERLGPEFERLSSRLRESEWFAREGLREYQEKRLALIVKHAYETVPYYRDLMDGLRLRPEDVSTPGTLCRLPVLTKENIRQNEQRLLSTGVAARNRRRVHTSGTTGSSLVVYWDRSVEIMNSACYWRIMRWAGFEFGAPYATSFGRVVVRPGVKRPPFWRVNGAWNQLLLSPLHMSRENLGHYVRAIREHGATMLEAYPSNAFLLARHLREMEDHLPLKFVYTTAEPLLPSERELIEERFCCSVFDGYGQAERVIFSGECERHSGHHLFEEYGITEIVDGDGSPVEPGGRGRAVATTLHNMAMPLIRYDTGDSFSIEPDACECGRSLPLIGGLLSRQEDIVVTPDGRMIPPLMLARAFKLVPGIVESQILQNRAEEIDIRMVVEKPLAEAEEERLRSDLGERLGPDVTINIEYVNEIPRHGRSKYRRVISTVPLPWENADGANRYEGSLHTE